MYFESGLELLNTGNTWLSLMSTDDNNTGSTDIMTFSNINGNIGVGLSGNNLADNNNEGSHVIWFRDGIAPTSAASSNSAGIYADNIGTTVEMRVMDEVGNITTISPHNFTLIPEGTSETLGWAYYSEHLPSQKAVNVDMMKMVRTVEKLSGENLVYTASLKDKKEDGTYSETDELKKIERSLTEKVKTLEEKVDLLMKKIKMMKSNDRK
jgi:hypothetical protein